MTYLIRWDPYREISNMRTALDRVVNDLMNVPHMLRQNGCWALTLDVAETDDGFMVKASLPGINPEDLEVTYDLNVLTIKGEVRKEEDVDEERYHLRERRYGTFSRSVSLPASIKADQIEANYQAGILTLHLPKSEDARPKRIKVRSIEDKALIEGKASSISKN